MIIDTHTHMSDGMFRVGDQPGYSTEETLKAMDDNGVTCAWISPASGLYANGEYPVCNDSLYNFCKGYEDRLVGFFTVNPNYGKKVVDEIKRCVEDYHFKGLKLHPWLQSFPIFHSVMDAITEACIGYGIPILFHDGTPPYASTLQIANLAERYPEVQIILGHSGLIEMYDNAISAANRLSNIILCLCGPSIFQLQKIIDNVSNDKIMFGSDFGFGKSTAGLVYRLDMWNYVKMDEETREKLFCKNALRLLH
jgi:predicted TIM-barrel fold metal-dependent hydrolase